MLHIGWRQIYEGYDMVLVGKIKEALEGENIDYKVEQIIQYEAECPEMSCLAGNLWYSMGSVQEQ